MTKPKPLPDAAFLRECLSYDPLTGMLTWRKRPRHHFPSEPAHGTWNTRWAGRPAGFTHSSGHKRGSPRSLCYCC